MLRSKPFARVLALLLILLFCAPLFPLPARASRTVRVGYYYAGNFQEGMSDNAVKRGYAYEYMQAISTYSGWNYEYIYANESTLYDLLVNGEIDMMAGIAYTATRSEQVLYPDRAMGVETYTLYTQIGSAVNFEDGLRVGTVKDSARTQYLILWAFDQGISIEIHEYSDASNMLYALVAGSVDAIVEADTGIGTDNTLVPLTPIGEADYYLVCSMKSPDLLKELNDAQASLAKNQSDYTQTLRDRYFSKSAAKAVLSEAESRYISEHPVLRVGYTDNYLPYCTTDDSGNPKGLITDVMNEIVSALNLQKQISVQYTPFASLSEMQKALTGGQIDILFPMPNSIWHSEKMQVSNTDTFCTVSMNLIFESYSSDTTKVIAVSEQDPLSRVYAESYYPDSQIVSYENEESALQAVLDDAAGCTLINSIRSRAQLSNRKYSSLIATSLENACHISMAVRHDDMDLRSLLNRGLSQLDSTQLQSQLIVISESMNEYTLWKFIVAHLGLVVTVCATIALLIFGTFAFEVFVLNRKNKELIRANAAREAAERETLRMLHSVEIDETTGVYTRQAFFAHAEETIHADSDFEFDLWLSDIENFKLINSMYGGVAGDRLLRFIASRLIAEMPDTLIGHFNADHFAVLIPHRQENTVDSVLALAMQLSADSPIPRTVVKFGIYRRIDRTLPVSLICDRAMVALQSLRGSYDRTVAEFDDPQIATIQRDAEMESSFADAIDSGEFKVWYQPKYSLRKARMAGVEALVRWQRADGTLIPPGQFIPLFEHDGLIRRLDEYVFRCVCRDIRDWIDHGFTPVPVSVNLSRNTLHSQNLARLYHDIAEVHNVPIDLLAIELTESAAVGDVSVRPLAETFIAAGFSLQMDDFGSGYSSLSSINALPFDTVKIDKTLIDGIGEQGGNEVLRHVIEMCHFKNMPVVAEGVEKQFQVDFLTRLGCEMIQGHYFSPAVPHDEFTEMLVANAKLVSETHAEEGINRVGQDSLIRYLTALGNIYSCIYVFDPVNDTVMEYSSVPYLREYINHPDGAADQLRAAIVNVATDEYMDAALEFTDLSTIRNRMMNRRNIATDLVGKRFGWVRIQFIAVSFDDDGYPLEVIFTLRVVEQEKRRESELIEAVRTDELTGVSNRRAFSEDIQGLLDMYVTSNLPSSFTVVSMDVNNLKRVNDNYGHAAGDELLRGAADCMNRAWGQDGMVYRVGGDEFIIFTNSAYVERNMAVFERYVNQWYGNQVSALRIACGIASAGEIDSNDINELICLADRRMYENKRNMKSLEP